MKKPSPGGSARAICAECTHCCCASSVSITEEKPSGSQVTKSHGVTSVNGHLFTANINMQYVPGKTESACQLVWEEKSNHPLTPGEKANEWNDIYKLRPNTATFDPWNTRHTPFGEGGPSSVAITDKPQFGNRDPNLTLRRKLDFRIGVKSGPDCKCPNRSASIEATQVLDMRDGQLREQVFTYDNPSVDKVE